jgi:glycosyltransferase involved in cell wall biosynthesis
MKVWSHTLVKNEERYLWFAINSVARYMDKIMIWDTGSSDQTVTVIKELKKLYPHKIEFKEVGEVDINEFADIRQKMVEETKSDWIFILDGDEVWWDDSIRELIELVDSRGENLESVVSRYVNVIGDIYHHQEERAGQYQIDGKKGHLTIRAMNARIPGLHAANPHGKQAYFDESGTPVQNRDRKKRRFQEKLGYMHFTHLIRSDTLEDDLKVPKRNIKYKKELGIPFPLDYYYPEVFFRSKPKIIQSPWVTMSQEFKWKSQILTPLRKLKRRFVPNTRSGY